MLACLPTCQRWLHLTHPPHPLCLHALSLTAKLSARSEVIISSGFLLIIRAYNPFALLLHCLSSSLCISALSLFLSLSLFGLHDCITRPGIAGSRSSQCLRPKVGNSQLCNASASRPPRTSVRWRRAYVTASTSAPAVWGSAAGGRRGSQGRPPRKGGGGEQRTVGGGQTTTRWTGRRRRTKAERAKGQWGEEVEEPKTVELTSEELPKPSWKNAASTRRTSKCLLIAPEIQKVHTAFKSRTFGGFRSKQRAWAN